MNIYLLHAHDYSYLPYQIWACRKFIDGTITVVEGPFRSHNRFDSRVRLDPDYPGGLGVGRMELTTAHCFGVYFRLLGLFNEILRLPGAKLIFAGDVLPICPMTFSGLSGRAIEFNGHNQIQWTWLYAEEPMELRRWPMMPSGPIRRTSRSRGLTSSTANRAFCTWTRSAAARWFRRSCGGFGTAYR